MENLFMQVQAALDLLARIFRMAEAPRRQRQPAMRSGAYVRIANQGENGMVKRRSRNLDGAALRRRGIGGQHVGEELPLLLNDELLVRERIFAALLDQAVNDGIVEKELVHPGDL